MKRPNVIFILIDDMGWKDLSCMGSEFYETPNIDRIAKEGMLFTDAYAACPVCSPTRASLMSGKYPARLGLTNFIGGQPHHSQEGAEMGRIIGAPYIPYLPTSEKSIATTLKESGYKTWHLGKWHLGTEEYWPENHGFEVNIGGCHAGHPPGPSNYFSPWTIPTIEPKDDDDYLTDRLGDEAANLIKEHDDSNPFFMNMCFYQVHTPLMAKEDKVKKYEQKVIDMGLDKKEAIVVGDYFPAEHTRKNRLKRRILQSHPVYAAMIEHLDENVGKILNALDDKNLSDNTILIFTSDNGGLSTSEGSPTCNFPLSEGKGWMYDGGTREPLLIRWPEKIEAGTKSDAVITSPDFYPTLLEACGVNKNPEQHCDGQSFYSVFAGDSEYDRGSIFWHFPHYGNQGGEAGCSIRKGDWKLIEFFELGCELYNLKEDIGEKNNLIDKFPDKFCELKTELDQWQSEVNAIIPKPNPDFKPWREADLKSID